MNTLVTIGPTQEPLDAMRILSNRSSGTLGTELALTLAGAGHRVIALRGTGSTAGITPLQRPEIRVIPFTTTANLRDALHLLSTEISVDAIFHAAAVSDYYFPEAGPGKIPTSGGAITLTFQPTPKILPRLREWFPKARITSWKFEAAGDHQSSISAAKNQLSSGHSDACVINGPSYGEGFGYLLRGENTRHFANARTLCDFLALGIAHAGG